MNCENCYLYAHHKVNPYLSIFTFINVAISPYSMSMFIKIYLDINVNDVYSYLFDSFSEKTLIKDNQCEL